MNGISDAGGPGLFQAAHVTLTLSASYHHHSPKNPPNSRPRAMVVYDRVGRVLIRASDPGSAEKPSDALNCHSDNLELSRPRNSSPEESHHRARRRIGDLLIGRAEALRNATRGARLTRSSDIFNLRLKLEKFTRSCKQNFVPDSCSRSPILTLTHPQDPNGGRPKTLGPFMESRHRCQLPAKPLEHVSIADLPGVENDGQFAAASLLEVQGSSRMMRFVPIRSESSVHSNEEWQIVYVAPRGQWRRLPA
ncbi:hypothetical protein B0H11DRAFT_1913979 [Mycena galericulata]|nr:hypothetical protein B0H11DRAFT_1913979 [Mycena galericulata]